MAKLRKVERRTKQILLFFMPRRSNFATTWQSYEKTRAEQKKLISFLCRVRVTYLKLRKNERSAKEKQHFFSLPSASNYQVSLPSVFPSRYAFGDTPFLRKKNLLNEAVSAKCRRSAICPIVSCVVRSRKEASMIRN